jgi:hypothetical protein
MNAGPLLRLQVRVRQVCIDWLESERGQTMVEYAGIGLVVVAIIAAIASALKGSGDAKLGKIIMTKISAIIDKIDTSKM